MKTVVRNFVAGAMVMVVAASAAGQTIKHVQGSQDAMTVVGAKDSGAATQPAGHPQMGAGDVPAAFHPEGMKKTTTGALRVVVTQGTKGGPAIGKDAMTVELYSQGKAIHTYTTVVGEGGVTEIHDLPLEVPFQPVVTVMHGGVREEQVGPPMHKYQPAVEMDMSVFEVTTEKPAWTSGIRHVTVEAVALGGRLGLHVTEMMGGFSPVDRVWVGEKGGTVAVKLPAGAEDVALGTGLAEARPTIGKGVITRGNPMMPGPTEYDFGYVLPVKDGVAELEFTVAADTTLFAVYMPTGFKVGKSVGLGTTASSGKYGLEGRQLLVGKGLKAGAVLTVELSGITPPPVAAAATMPAEEHTTLDLPRPKTTNVEAKP